MGFLLAKSDAELVRQTLSGRRTAYNTLVERHLRSVYAVGRAWASTGAEVEDVAQEAFLAAFQRLPSLRDPGRFKAWILGIARNIAISAVRRQVREGKAMKRLGKEQENEPAAGASEPELREVRALVRREIRQLEGPVREVVLLHYFAGKSSREIAEMLELSPAAVRKRLQRARETLGERLLTLQGNEEQEAEEVWQARAGSIAGMIVLAEVPWLPSTTGAGGASAAASGGGKMLTMSALVKGMFATVAATAAVISGVLLMAPSSEDTAPIPNGADSPVAAETPLAIANGVSAPPTAAEDGESDTLSELLNSLNAVASARETDESDTLTGPYAFSGWVDTPGATVVLVRTRMHGLPISPEEAIERVQTADEYGGFCFPGLPVGKYVVLAFSENGFAAEDGRTDQHPEVFVEMYLMPTEPLSGWVVNETGAPVGNAILYGHQYSLWPERLPFTVTTATAVQTDPDGSFDVPYATPGKWRMWIAAEGYANTLCDWIETGTENTLVLRRGVALRGRVMDAVSGESVAEVPVLVTRTESGRERVWRDRKRAVTAADGTFGVRVQSGKSYFVTIDRGEWVGTKVLRVDLAEDASPAEVVMPARVGGIVGGRAYDVETGEPLAHQRVRLSALEDRETFCFEYRETVTDADGYYMYKGLPRGACTVSLWRCEGYPDGAESIDVTVEYETTQLNADIALSKGIPIQGYVFDAWGAPANLAKVEAQCAAGKNTVATKPDGSFLCALPPGVEEVSLVASKPGMAMRPSSPRQLPPEGLSGVILRLDATGSVAGVVVDAEGNALSRITVTAAHRLHREASLRAVHANPDGTFFIDTLLPGPNDFELSKHNSRTWVKAGEITVKAGQAIEGVTLVYEKPVETE